MSKPHSAPMDHMIGERGSGSSYRVAVVSGRDELCRIRPNWDKLAGASAYPNVFSTWEWIWAWWIHHGENEKAVRLFCLAVWRGSELSGIVPLALRGTVRGGRAIRKLEFPDVAFADYFDPLLDRDFEGQLDAICAFLQTNRELWDLLFLRRLSGAGRLPELWRSSIADAGLRFRKRPDEGYLQMPLDCSWEAWLNSRSANLRSTFRNKTNRLAELKDRGLHIGITTSPHTEPRLLERMIAVERKRIASGRRGALLSVEQSFFATLLQELGPRGLVYVATMELRHQLIAYELGMLCGERICCYTKAYDPEFAQYGPGLLLVPTVFEFGFRNGFRTYDLLRGQEDFKKRLAAQVNAPVRLDVWNTTWRSQVAAAIYFGIRNRVLRLGFALRREPVHPDL